MQRVRIVRELRHHYHCSVCVRVRPFLVALTAITFRFLWNRVTKLNHSRSEFWFERTSFVKATSTLKFFPKSNNFLMKMLVHFAPEGARISAEWDSGVQGFGLSPSL